MTDDTQSQLVDLQIRVTHQEAAIETLTQNHLAMEKQLLMLGKQLQDIKSMLREVMPSLVVPQAEEKPPPHY
ncbi:MAG: SlyX family protein [Gammaproteobacteria bacterium]|jgi:SlyX protein